MKEIYEFIVNPTLGKFLATVLLPILGAAMSNISKRWEIGRIVSNKRVTYRLFSLSVLGIVSVAFNWHILAWAIFSLLILASAFCPLPHEIIALKLNSTYNSERRNICIISTPAHLKYYKKKIRSTNNIIQKERLSLEFFEEVKGNKWELFDWEIKKFYIPFLLTYYEMGAITRLGNELKELSRFNDNHDYQMLQMVYADVTCNYSHMAEAFNKLRSLEENGENELVITSHINEMVVAERLGQPEREQEAVKILERDYEQVKFTMSLLVSNLMEYYDRKGMLEKADKLADDLEACNSSDFESFLGIKDIAFMHYRRVGDNDKIQRMLNELWKANEKMQSGENKMITRLRFMNIIFNNNGPWQQYSISIFKSHNDYLNYSWRVGVEFVKQMTLLMRDAHSVYNLSLNDTKQELLFNDIDSHLDSYISELDKEISKTPTEMLYVYKSLLMDKLDVVCFKYVNDYVAFCESRYDIYDRILNVCRENGNIREQIHFLMVYIDDILTMHKQLVEEYTKQPDRSSIEYNRYLTYWNVYKDRAVDKLSEFDALLADKGSDPSLAYNILYASYFHYLMDNKTKALDYYNKFNKTGVSIKNFTQPIQLLYNELKEKVADETVRWEMPDGRFVYTNLKI